MRHCALGPLDDPFSPTWWESGDPVDPLTGALHSGWRWIFRGGGE